MDNLLNNWRKQITRNKTKSIHAMAKITKWTKGRKHCPLHAWLYYNLISLQIHEIMFQLHQFLDMACLSLPVCIKGHTQACPSGNLCMKTLETSGLIHWLSNLLHILICFLVCHDLTQYLSTTQLWRFQYICGKSMSFMHWPW